MLHPLETAAKLPSQLGSRTFLEGFELTWQPFMASLWGSRMESLGRLKKDRDVWGEPGFQDDRTKIA